MYFDDTFIGLHVASNQRKFFVLLAVHGALFGYTDGKFLHPECQGCLLRAVGITDRLHWLLFVCFCLFPFLI